MKVIYLYLICCAVLVAVYCSTISRVQLVDHEDYIVSLIGETMRKVEEMEWCNLKVNDVTQDLNEDVLGTEVMGRIEYTNTFVVSIQWVDIERDKVKQVWKFDRTDNRTTVEVRGGLRLHAVTIGFDVQATLAEGVERYTAAITHPMLQFDFTVIKDMNNLDDVSVTVFGLVVPKTTDPIRFLPTTEHSKIFASMFDWNSTSVGIRSWGPDVFQPFAYELVTNEIQFPRICYNCPEQ